MATSTLTDCSQLDTTLLERVNYFPRQLLTADDMTADQQYFIAKFKRHNRYLHGWGVVCGLEVSVAPTTPRPWQVQIGSGYALGPYGDEIYVPNPVLLDLAQCGPGASTDPCDPGTLLQGGIAKTGSLFYIAIRYEECLARPVRVLPGGCGCNDTACEPSRISDSYEIECLADLPPSGHPGPQGPSLCDILSGSALAQCPPCPSDPWVVLAQVRLPAALGSTLPQANIDNVSVRRKIFSTAVIQEQVRLCCCAGSDRAPARVTSITPANGTVFTNDSSIPPVMVVTFDKHLVIASVNITTILVLRIEPSGVSKPVQGTVTYDDGTRTATFTPADSFTIPGSYQVTVVGSGPSVITDSDNLALDGNADGAPGGNFLSQFSVQTSAGPTPTPTPSASPTVRPTPTREAPPLKIAVKGPSPIPNAKATNPSAVGDLAITFAGGDSAQKLTLTVTVTLSANLASTTAADTATWKDSQGNSVQASKGANSYTFNNIVITPPGTGAPVNAKILNMKVNASQLGAAGSTDVLALVAMTPITSGTTLPTIAGANPTVAHVVG